MYDYYLAQWLLFFFIYCFFGWIWESCYVSVKKRKWVNRGFLHGPLIPIYGFGAVTVLLVVIPVREHLVLVYFLGMAAATVLEYVTGAAMEKLFKVRYWDYSEKPMNLHGYICLISSLAWGAFSVLLIHVIHMPVERLVLGMELGTAEILAFFTTVMFAADATQSFNEAMDLREMIEKLTESSQELRRIQKRMDVIIAVIDADVQEGRKKAGELWKKADEYLSVEKWAPELSETINVYLERAKKKSAETAQGLKEEIARLSEEMGGFQEILKVQQEKAGMVKSRRYVRSLRMLHRNPGAVSKIYREALEEIRGKSGIVSRIKRKNGRGGGTCQ